MKKNKKNERKLTENSKTNRMIQKKTMLRKQISPHLKILRKFVTKFVLFVTKFVFILKHNFSFLTEIQIVKINETNKSVINAMHQMKMISVRTEKTSTADFVNASKLISTAIATEATNILQTNHNLISNFIEISNTTLNSENLNLISIFNLTTQSQSLRSFAEKMQYRKKFTEQFQKQQHQQIQFKFGSIVDISAIDSFESENMTLYEILDLYEKTLTSIIKIKFSWRLITDFEFYSWKADHVFSKKKSDFPAQNFILNDKKTLMIMTLNLSIQNRRIMYFVNFDRKGISAKNLIEINEIAKTLNDKEMYWYLKAKEVKFHKTKKKLNLKRKHEIRNFSKIKIMSAKALFQNEIKRSNDFGYWKKVIAYWKNMKKSDSNHIEFKNQIKKKKRTC